MRTAVGLLLTGLPLLIALFWAECVAAVSVWLNSTAYGHCFLVIPIVAYLIWDRSESLRGFTPAPTPVFVLLGFPLSVVWLFAERLGIMEGRQLVFISIVELLFLTALGWRLFQALMGPLLYLVFLVPFGTFLTPVLQKFTASFIDIGLTLLQIPHFVTAMVIEISAGTFFVAEACAGLRFLIASIAFGVFFALLNYRSTGRRAAFIIASVLIPIVANGFRALGIVVLGQILGSAEAAAADHLLYGWIFFSIVMLFLVAIGLPFRQPPGKLIAADRGAAAAPDHAWAAFIVILVAAIGPATAWALDSRSEPGRLHSIPTFTAPSGCSFAEPDATVPRPDRYATVMTCQGRVWTIVMQVVPMKSSASELNEVGNRLAGSLDPEQTIPTCLPNAPGWQAIVSGEPAQIVAISYWLDGHLSKGGMERRLLQARYSLFGAAHEPLVMAITTKSARPFSENERLALLAEASRFLTAQTDLPGIISDVSTR